MADTQGGSNVAIVALIVIAVLVAGAAFLFFGSGGSGTGSGSNTVVERTVEKATPDVDVDIRKEDGAGVSLSHESDSGDRTAIEADP